MQKRPIAYQVYSAREEAAQNLDAVLAELAAMGYDGVEFAGFYGHSAQDIAAMLTKHGLIALSSHVPLAAMQADPFGVIAYHQTIGCSYIAIPYLDDTTRPGAPGFAAVLQFIYKFAALCREAGIQLLYHNHDFEFVTISGQYGLDFLYDAVPASLLATEIDVCWVKYAGLNPADYLRGYAGRCPVVHLKDYVGTRDGHPPYALIGLPQSEPDESAKQAFEFRPFGHGSQDVPSVLTAAIESGAQWFVVEQDMAVGMTPLEAARASIETLRKAGVKA